MKTTSWSLVVCLSFLGVGSLAGQIPPWNSNRPGATKSAGIVINLTAPCLFTSAANGVSFDIDADGDLDQVAWTLPGSQTSFLARDLNGDGRITSGKELFGHYTVPGVKHGIEALALAARASNGNVMRGSVSEDDPLFFELLLWTDRNHDGNSDPSELEPVQNTLAAVGLGYQVALRRDTHGNAFVYRGWVHVRTALGRNIAQSPAEEAARRHHSWDVNVAVQP